MGSGGYPHVKNAVLQKRPVATRAKSDDFGAIWGRPGGSLGTLFRHLGAPRRDFARPMARKRPSGRGSGRHVRKMERKCLKREAVGTLKTWFSYRSVGKNHNVVRLQKNAFSGGLGDPKRRQKRDQERHYTHRGGSRVPLQASVRRLLRDLFFNAFSVPFSSTFGSGRGGQKWSRRLAGSIIIKFSLFSVLLCGFGTVLAFQSFCVP